MTDTSVRVAVRIRPQMPSEVIDMCHICTTVTPGEPQVVLGKDRAFTFDNVFDTGSTQEEVYSSCIQDLIKGCLQGYNATILAYGQTGSGKTYTMGTGFDLTVSENEKGIIPRAVHHLFNGINTMRNEAINKGSTPPEFKVVAQFMELYNEEIIDLLVEGDIEDRSRKCIKIHESNEGEIYTSGITSFPVTSASETLNCLKAGALSRTTASTNMNAQSSRSHAIFTLHIKVERVVEFESNELSESAPEEFETLMAKLHFVDLAGSERLKRTGATGERAREGISINCGLLALGNVISALGDKSRKATHVPYRDSKLTRLLQDSLGGNSQTLMIACVSPSDRDFMETLNTLKYANRAKNIKNKVMINQDKSSQTISMLRREIQQLQLELLEYKQGKRIMTEDGEEQVNDMFHENMFLQTEVDNLRSRLKALQETLDHQTKRVTELLAEKAAGLWVSSGDSTDANMSGLIQGYMKEIEELRVKLMESDELCSQLRKQVQRNQRMSYQNPTLLGMDVFSTSQSPGSTFDLIINEAKQEIEKDLERQAKAMKKPKILENGNAEEGKDIDEEKEKEDSPEVTSCKMNGDVQTNSNDEELTGEEEDGSSDDESDSEDKSATENCSVDLAQLTQDISMKQKLIEALEQSQQRLKIMKKHYEDKVLQLELKIQQTQSERDRVLSTLGKNKGKQSDEKVKQTKEEYEKKLQGLQSELRKMQVVKKEHTKAMRNQAQYERQVQQLKNEVIEMKKTKVRLINKMKEDNQKHLQHEQRRQREIAQLKKQGRQRENQIRNLEAENRLKENVLKRKQEEIMALRKSNKSGMSDKVAGRVSKKADLNSTFVVPFWQKVVKNRWQHLEKSINQLVISKQSIHCIGRDMDRYMKEREKLSKKLEILKEKREIAVKENKSPDIIQDYDENIETLKANIAYCQENIAECQSSIVEMEGEKDEADILDVEKMVTSLPESKYLLQKLINMAINQVPSILIGVRLTFQAFEKDAALREMEEKLKQSRNNNCIQVGFLEKIYRDSNSKPEELEYMISNENDPFFESECSSRCSSPDDSCVSEPPNIQTASSRPSTFKKRRRETLMPSEVRATVRQSDVDALNLASRGSVPSVADVSSKLSSSRLAQSVGPSLQLELNGDKTLVSSSSNPDLSRKYERSPFTRRRMREMQSVMADFSPVFRRKFDPQMTVIATPPLSRQSSTDTAISDISPPDSPSSKRKDVFDRLAVRGSMRRYKRESGEILDYVQKNNIFKNSILTCTHVARGHIRDVVSLAVTEDRLFTGSTDGTVKIWDLTAGKEIQSLPGHPHGVLAVRFNENSQLAFSVFTSVVKVWDVRENPVKCIKMLSSTGEAIPAPTSTSDLKRQGPTINDIALNPSGTTFFSASGSTVRFWDVRMLKAIDVIEAENSKSDSVEVENSKTDSAPKAIGKLKTGQNAEIKCILVDTVKGNKNRIVTGSKDHLIKVYEVEDGKPGNFFPKKVLDKNPHYDGVQSLALSGDVLFSGSRDKFIKKWNLKKYEEQLQFQAHDDWVMALSIFRGSYLVSGCKKGFLKIWSVDSPQLQLLATVKAYEKEIKAIGTNQSHIFTASSDCSVGIWKLNS